MQKILKVLGATAVFAIVAGCEPHSQPVAADTSNSAPSSSVTTSNGETAQKWPTSAELALAQSDDEKRYLGDHPCWDGSECYGPARFRRFVFKRYPDIAKIAYRASKDIAPDRDMLEWRKANFYQALYFAKQIELANGQTLFDFIRTCSRGFTSLDSAELAYGEQGKDAYFDVQYFPTLRRADTGAEVEMQILFERRGDKLIAKSPFFTSNALRYPDFLERHRLTCLPRG